MSLNPNQHGSASAPRSRLWVPGLAFVTLPGDVHLGRSAGFSSRDPAFLHLACGYRSRVLDWTHVAWLVPRSELTAAVVAEHAVILPESLLDRQAQPHAHRWLREQPLVCVSGLTWKRLAESGVRAFRVAFDATGDRLLHIEDTGGPSELIVSLDALQEAMKVAHAGHPLVDLQGDPTPIDRAMRLLSAGAIDEIAVLNAFDARRVIEDGYGYRGALEGRFTDVDRVARELHPLDALFGQIFSRATRQRSIAEHLLGALSRATRDEGPVAVPLYGSARPIAVPPLRVPRVERLRLRGESHVDLELSSERRWSVDHVDSWSPTLPAHLHARSHRDS